MIDIKINQLLHTVTYTLENEFDDELCCLFVQINLLKFHITYIKDMPRSLSSHRSYTFVVTSNRTVFFFDILLIILTPFI